MWPTAGAIVFNFHHSFLAAAHLLNFSASSTFIKFPCWGLFFYLKTKIVYNANMAKSKTKTKAKKKSKKKGRGTSKNKDGLTPKQFNWCLHYAELGNGTEAAARAGYKGSRRTLAAIGSENLEKPHIIKKLDEIYSTWGMGAKETLARIAKIARGFDPADYVTERELWDYDKNGDRFLVGLVLSFDLKAFKKDGFGILIKKVKQNSRGGMEVEFHDPVRGLEMSAKNHALLTDRILDDGKKEFHVTIGGAEAE